MAERLIKALESPTEKDSDRISNLASLVAELSKVMKPEEATTILIRGATVAANAAKPSGQLLLELVERLPTAAKTRLYAISQILESGALNEAPPSYQDQTLIKSFTAICTKLDQKQLVELLKWPFCVGEAERIVLAELERKSNKRLDGHRWKFIEQALELRIDNLDSPPQRPSIEQARDELTHLASGAPKQSY